MLDWDTSEAMRTGNGVGEAERFSLEATLEKTKNQMMGWPKT